MIIATFVKDINYHLKSKRITGVQVKHLPYKKSTSIYVAKFICDKKTNWGRVNNNS